MSFYDPTDLLQAPRPGAMRRLAYENGILFLTIEFEPGFKASPHKHTWPTLYYVTNGNGRVMIGAEWRNVGPGVLAMIPPDTMHSIEATTPLSLIEVQSNCPQQFVDGLLGR